MKTTIFVILSRFKLDAHESNCTDFVAEDLIDLINNDDTIIVTDLEHLEEIKNASPYNRYEYSIKIESKV